MNSAVLVEESSSSSSSSSNDGLFDCNICLDSARDPKVTLCGHLFCWPCLYKWLHTNSSQHCPVCKGTIEENKLIHLYGRGKIVRLETCMSPVPVDDQTNSLVVPSRPTGHRNLNHHHHLRGRREIGQMSTGEFLSPSMTMSARWTNFVIAAGIIGLFPSLFSFPFHGLPNIGLPYDQSDVDDFADGIPFDDVDRRQQLYLYLNRVFVVICSLIVFLSLKWV